LKKPKNKSSDHSKSDYDLRSATMLDEPGILVEPDVRKSLIQYFEEMGMLENKSRALPLLASIFK
jgi:hypothetical protein